ncbi:bifunctional polysaccharide deacetylase/glycosyltransferase family 2 protein [Streptomyces sp. NPDC048409]|uniref:bifunctional polysaccharide deacetylase/glycosyltransferase family 2 protein n=1 Tax=Streptomyces sp. NPDC048409 TaxID=3154723 RepID=UPI00341B97AA
MSRRHAAVRRSPRAHWLLFLLVLSVLAASLVLEGWTTHQVDAARTKIPCSRPIPRQADTGRPVLRFGPHRVRTASMPPGTVALTFDGGPDPTWTPRILDLLHRYDVHATFFVYGRQVARYPALARRIVREGHELGSYTYTGGDLGAASAPRARLELSLTRTALAGAAGVSTRLLRLPHTTAADTLCGPEWTAAGEAAREGYLIVAADATTRRPEQGAVTQYSQTDLGYREARAVLRNHRVARFTTVGAGLGASSVVTPVTGVRHAQGVGLIGAQRLGHFLAEAMAWGLAATGVLGLLRLLMLTLLARVHVRRQHSCRPGAPGPLPVRDPVTVLVPAYNEEAGIASTLGSLLASTHTDLQIIVIDDGSTDSTAAIAEAIGDPRVTVIRQPNAGKPRALNTGLARARHDIVVMVDADTVFEPEALGRLVQPLADPQVGAVSGNTKVGNKQTLLGRWQHLEYVIGFNLDRRMLEILQCMPTVPGAIGAFRRHALLGIGGISDETLAEDTDLTMALWRAGWRVVYAESAVAWTEVPDTLGQLWRQRYRWCYGTLQSMWKHRRAVIESGPAGRFGRRALSYLALFQVVLPLCAPMADVVALYGVVFRTPAEAVAVWLCFVAAQLLSAGYALRLDRERLGALWVLPFQMFVYRQLMYLVVIQSVVTALMGSRLRWHSMERSGTADPYLAGEPPHPRTPAQVPAR